MFATLLGRLAVALTVSAGCATQEHVGLSLGPILGAVSDRDVKVWARSEQALSWSVTYWPVGEPGDPNHLAAPDFAEAADFTSVVRIHGLQPDTTYAYRVAVDTRDLPGEHRFSTLPAAGAAGRIRFVAAADVNGGDIPGFLDIASTEPDFVLMLGDNVYADGHGDTFEAYQSRYHEVWGGTQFQELFSQYPAFRIWDDHELVNDYWQGKNDEVYAFASQLYDIYQGSQNPDALIPGSHHYTFEAGEVGFFVLDTRTHRSPNNDSDGPDKSMLGQPQKRALARWLQENKHQVHVVVSSVLVSDFSTTGRDSWQAFSHERDEILDLVWQHQTNNVLIVSGDQHWSAVIRIDHGQSDPYSIYEFQATPLGSSERGTPSWADETVLALDNNHRVFGVFDIDTSGDVARVEYTLCAVGMPCRPHEEAVPVTVQTSATVPYSLSFEGSHTGLQLVKGP